MYTTLICKVICTLVSGETIGSSKSHNCPYYSLTEHSILLGIYERAITFNMFTCMYQCCEMQLNVTIQTIYLMQNHY